MNAFEENRSKNVHLNLQYLVQYIASRLQRNAKNTEFLERGQESSKF